MKYIDPESIKSTFSILNESGIDYILIRNINNEIPEKLVEGKDIDILAKYSDKNKLNELLVQSGFSRINLILSIVILGYYINYKNFSDFFREFCKSINLGKIL